MKKLILAFAFFSMATISTYATSIWSPTPIFLKIEGDWMKSKTQTWPGMFEGKTYWYKLDKMAKLWWSADGKKWAAVESGSWMDKDGKWLKIHEGKLVWSADGDSWSEVPEWKWEGSDGKWYKFDNSWKLWVNK
ncbi:hypothetical protein ABDK00_004070 [Niabella insulamsoli]|uniref:hypothetical protein n=1 Tax=Niabella insulamsoli TaxID=3144874 RepID=UPI0031FDBF91